MNPKVEKVFKQRRWLLRFMTETPFHGFDIAANATSVAELITWLSMILLCASLTVYQTISLITLYRSEPTMTVITVKHNGTFACRNTHVCFTWEFDPDAIVTDLTRVEMLLSGVTDAHLKQIQIGTVTTTTFDPALLRLILAMLSDITGQEANVFGSKVPQTQVVWGLSASDAAGTTAVDLRRNVAIHKVYHFFASRQISLGQLMQSTASVACQVMQWKVEMTNFDTLAGRFQRIDMNICHPSNFASMGDLGFCMFADTSNERLLFRNTFDFLITSGNPTLLDVFFNQRGFENAKGSVLIDLVGGKSTDLLNGYIISNDYMKHTRTTVDIHGHYRSYSSRRRACYAQNNEAANCRSYCRANLIADLCNCWPLYFFVLEPKTSGMRLCVDRMGVGQNSTPYYIPDYHECLKNKDFGAKDPSYDCQQRCLDDCEHTKLTFVTEPNTDVYKLTYCSNCSTLHVIKFGSFAYPYMEEVLAKSLESFMAEFGGLIGLWLGGSLIAFTHVFVFLARMAHEKCVSWVALSQTER